ncbi:hypothetical protein D3C80_1488430 [compost metagenome]
MVLSKFLILVVSRLISITFPSSLYLVTLIQSPTLKSLDVATWIPEINPRIVSRKISSTTAVIAPSPAKILPGEMRRNIDREIMT